LQSCSEGSEHSNLEAKSSTVLGAKQGTAIVALTKWAGRASIYFSAQRKRRGLKFDAELLYAGAMFHDMGLVPAHSSADEHFEVDGANGTPISVFDGFRPALAANRAEFFTAVASGPFYGFNRPSAKVSQAVIDNWWRQGMMGSALAHYEGIKAFSERIRLTISRP
jgi:hypothetical protein